MIRARLLDVKDLVNETTVSLNAPLYLSPDLAIIAMKPQDWALAFRQEQHHYRL
ncbi:MAG: hypothetical protein RXP86_10360 [Acidilobus sp.]|jgi:hypothetical protein